MQNVWGLRMQFEVKVDLADEWMWDSSSWICDIEVNSSEFLSQKELLDKSIAIIVVWMGEYVMVFAKFYIFVSGLVIIEFKARRARVESLTFPR